MGYRLQPSGNGESFLVSFQLSLHDRSLSARGALLVLPYGRRAAHERRLPNVSSSDTSGVKPSLSSKAIHHHKLRLLNVLPLRLRSVYSQTVMAHSHGAATTDANGTVMSSMIPWLHFDTGDNLFFSSWHPNTPGALVGASIGLIFLALFERWIAAIRGTMEAHWKRQ